MKVILCQPAIERFRWELEVCITRLQKLGYDEIVLLFAKYESSIPDYFRNKYGVECRVYNDDRGFKDYQPSIKPYLWWRYLEENPEAEKDDYLYVDSDVILRDTLDVINLDLDPTHWFASDCEGYLGYDYIMGCEDGESIARRMAHIVRIPYQELEKLRGNYGGAQWLISKPTAKYWHKVYDDTTTMHMYFQTVDSNIQKWTAEMWAQLFNMVYFGIKTSVVTELDFCWATDPIDKWESKKIYHNAGVTHEDKQLFFKGLYDNGRSPFLEDLSFVDKSRCSSKYVEAIKEVKMTT